MAAKSRKGLRGSIDDVLGDLLGYDDETPGKSARASQLAGGSGGRARGTGSPASKKSFPEDDFFSKLPAEDIKAAEGSDVSDADPQAVLQTLKDMDDMEADLLGISKPSSGPGKMTAKGPEKWDPAGGAVKSAGKLLTPEKESAPAMEKKPLSSPPASRQYRKFNFEDLDDPLEGLLSDEEKNAPKKPIPSGTENSSVKKLELSKEKEPPAPRHAAAPGRRREELTFEDDGDDLMDALGFGDSPKGDPKQGRKEDKDELWPARSKLDELLGRGSAAKAPERPGAGERREFKLDTKYQKQPEKEEPGDEEDFVFGAYQPTVASARRQPARYRAVRLCPSDRCHAAPKPGCPLWGWFVTPSRHSRFSAESSSDWKPDPRANPPPPPPAGRGPARGGRAGGDWLGLKDEDLLDSDPPSPAQASAAGSCPSPTVARRPDPASRLPAAEEPAAKRNPPEEDNWLSTALSRKKAQAQAKAQERGAEPSEAPSRGLDPRPATSQPATSTGAAPQAAAPQDTAASAAGSGHPVPWLSAPQKAPALPPESRKEDPSGDTSALAPAASFPGQQEMPGPAPLAQAAVPRTHLPAAPQPQAEPLALGSLQVKGPGAPAAQLSEDGAGCRAALLGAQARVAELESQVRTLELERTQQKLLLESLQQRHQEDLDLLESAHRSRVKVVEETYGQREERLRQEKERLAAQLVSQSQAAEQARAELLARHQQQLAALEQRSAQELQRVRELQRTSVQEMHKDHEEQLQRLKRLKEQEIDAVTSATSHTRSLNGVIEQMEKFSSDLHDLSHRVEATHHTTSQELAMGAQQRDKQLKVLQHRLSQQQRDMEEERSRLQEVIAKMEARLGEQTRLLEQERWRATAEQSKVESLQHSLEEQRRVMTQQLSMERAELERAKSALLEEQKSVMQKCSEERRKLAAEWAEFHTQQQLSKERLERDMDRALQRDSQREGTIMSLAKEQAELKIQASELKAKEEQLVRDRELLDQAWQELRLEKEKVNGAALHIRQRVEEIDTMSRLSAQKCEEGQRALREARRVESEHQARLRVVQQHLEQLKQQEQRLHQERLSMALQRSQLQQLREELPNNPTLLLTTAQDVGIPAKGLSGTLRFPPPITAFPRRSPGGSRDGLGTAGPSELYTKLLLLKHRAEQDRDFLEDEQFFLETLKKASYNTSSLLA
ncbi:fas-binding factor 1 isoform X2 [Dromaius novaehollandiae]|uniref:fas-binding factor 1 isoform X2 n=1 Tax=Dromaius novaehollandiae TaxID=8790 RepID=UPI0031202D62